MADICIHKKCYVNATHRNMYCEQSFSTEKCLVRSPGCSHDSTSVKCVISLHSEGKKLSPTVFSGHAVDVKDSMDLLPLHVFKYSYHTVGANNAQWDRSLHASSPGPGTGPPPQSSLPQIH